VAKLPIGYHIEGRSRKRKELAAGPETEMGVAVAIEGEMSTIGVIEAVAGLAAGRPSPAPEVMTTGEEDEVTRDRSNSGIYMYVYT
jgi:hypothetical protein